MGQLYIYGSAYLTSSHVERALFGLGFQTALHVDRTLFSASLDTANRGKARAILAEIAEAQKGFPNVPISVQWGMLHTVGTTPFSPAGFNYQQGWAILLNGEIQEYSGERWLDTLVTFELRNRVSYGGQESAVIRRANQVLASMGHDTYMIEPSASGWVLIDTDDITTGGGSQRIRGHITRPVKPNLNYLVAQRIGLHGAAIQIGMHPIFSSAVRTLMTIPALEIIEDEW